MATERPQREALKAGPNLEAELPPEFTRPEVAQVLRVWAARSAQ